MMKEQELRQKNNKMDILWEPVGDGARVLRVFGYDMEVILPDEVEGRPVTEIGAYCFSPSERFQNGLQRETYVITGADGERISQSAMPDISGKYVEKVVLPDSVRVLHNAAFYNCRNLEELSVGKKIDAMGSDEFMNCTRLKRVTVRGKWDEVQGLHLILERISTDVEVFFAAGPEKDAGVCREKYQSVLFFPEYYEWLNEISPAHIFSRSIEGEGFRMRQAFLDGHIDYHKYDQCFENALITESDRTLCQIALDRLLWPQGLTPDAEEFYGKAIQKRYEPAIDIVVKRRDLHALQFLCERFQPDGEEITRWMNQCINAQWSEGNVYLMEEKHKTCSLFDKTFDFDDF